MKCSFQSIAMELSSNTGRRLRSCQPMTGLHVSQINNGKTLGFSLMLVVLFSRRGESRNLARKANGSCAANDNPFERDGHFPVLVG